MYWNFQNIFNVVFCVLRLYTTRYDNSLENDKSLYDKIKHKLWYYYMSHAFIHSDSCGPADYIMVNDFSKAALLGLRGELEHDETCEKFIKEYESIYHSLSGYDWNEKKKAEVTNA